MDSKSENKVVIKYIPSPDDREKIYKELYTKYYNNYPLEYFSFTYLDKSKPYYLRVLVQCVDCKKKWFPDELIQTMDDYSDDDTWYRCPDENCKCNLGTVIWNSNCKKYNYLINNTLVYSNNKELLINYHKNNYLHKKKIRKVYWYEFEDRFKNQFDSFSEEEIHKKNLRFIKDALYIDFTKDIKNLYINHLYETLNRCKFIYTWDLL